MEYTITHQMEVVFFNIDLMEHEIHTNNIGIRNETNWLIRKLKNKHWETFSRRLDGDLEGHKNKYF